MSHVNEDPAEINEQLLALMNVELHIEELKRQLETAQRTRDEIQERLGAYRASCAPIGRLPHEVLILIFQSSSGTQKKRNHSLMLVSRLWYRIVLDSPCLWNDIVVEVKSPATMIDSWMYVAACLRHSKDAFLDIRVDGRNFQIAEFADPVEDLRGGYQKLAALYPDSTASCEVSRTDAVTFSSVHMALATREQLCVMTMDMTLSILKGYHNKRMERWRSFIFELYDDDNARDQVAAELWNSIQGHAINLVSLEFRLYDSEGELRDGGGGITYTGFPGLGRLEAFRTDLAMPYDKLPGSIDQLRELELYSSRASNNFIRHASRFCSLRILGLYFPYTDAPLEPGYVIELPVLERLYLRGHYHTTLVRQLSTPRLNHLCIMHPPNTCYPPTKSFSSVKLLSWSGYSDGNGEDAVDYNGDGGERLESLLKQLVSLARIRLWESDSVGADPAEIAWVKRLKLDRSVPSSLEKIQIIDKDALLSTGRVIKTLHV